MIKVPIVENQLHHHIHRNKIGSDNDFALVFSEMAMNIVFRVRENSKVVNKTIYIAVGLKTRWLLGSTGP